VPTFAEYVPVVSGAVSAGTRRAYGTYWNRVVEHWGGRRLDEPTPSEIRQLMALVKAGAVQRRNGRGGRSSQEHLVGALRCLYRHAEDDGLIDERDNPARKVDKPRRLPSTRRAVADTRLAEICQVAATTGDDPELDTLILRLHTETACRRGGALALRPRTWTPSSAWSCYGRRARPSAGSPSPPRSWPRLCGTPPNALPRQAGGCCATAMGGRSPTGATTGCGSASAGTCPGPAPNRSAPTGCGTPP
jgi:hypothetical protein